MADAKISALTAQTTVAADDMFVLATAAGATKKITGANLKLATGALPSAAAVRYVAGTGVGLSGSDSNDGLSPSRAMATLQAAYDSLPNTSGNDHGGGTIVLLPGYHDVGTGFVGDGLQKHAVVTSFTGWHPWKNAAARGATVPLGYATIYTSQNATSLVTIGNEAGAATNQEGWAFLGIGFDMTDGDTTWAIDARDVLYGQVHGCAFEGGTDMNLNRQAIRCRVVNASDASYWKVTNNWTRLLGLAHFGDGATNNNGHFFGWNVIFTGNDSDGIVLDHATRCWTLANNFEGSTMSAIKCLSTDYCAFLFDSAEDGNAYSPFISLDSASGGNLVLPLGWDDLDSPPSYSVTDSGNSPSSRQMGFSNPPVRGYSDSHSLDLTDLGCHVRMNKATALNLTVEPNSTTKYPKGFRCQVEQRGAGQVTILPGSGVTVRSRLGLKTAGQYAQFTLTCVDHTGNEWVAAGDLTT